MSADVAISAMPDPDMPIEDVWSRTGGKYRRRAIYLLTLNALLFAGLGCVAYWMRTGVAFAPATENYSEQLAATFNPTTQTSYTPVGLSLGPVSVEHVPMMIPVLGLILAALVSIPILITMLYRLPCALPFLAVVGFLAVMPWLAIALMGSCLLVSINPLRFRSRFASTLLALLPVILYFFMASRQDSAVVAPLTDPADRVKMVAPLILAVIASAVVMGAVLIIAKLVNYRPGAVAPLLAILFLTPAALFEFQVGRDELHYRLLEREYGPGSEYFVGEKIGHIFEEAVERAFLAKKNEGLSYEAVRRFVELRWLLALDADASLLFTEYQDQAARAARRFVQLFPDSVYAINALYIEGRALDMRVDLERLRREHELAFYSDFPSERSRLAWEKIEYNAPHSPTGAEALLRLAMLDVRVAEVNRAIERLERLEVEFGRVDRIDDRPAPDSPIDTIMQRESPERGLDIAVQPTVLAGLKLLHLIENNRDPLWEDDPLVELALLDPQYTRYADNLRALLDRYPRCQLEDNIHLRIAQSESDPAKRIEMLNEDIQRYEGGDAECAMIYELGLAQQEARQIGEARSSFQRLTDDCADSIWREQSEARIRQLDRSATTEGA